MKFKAVPARHYKQIFWMCAVFAAMALASYMYVGVLIKRQADLLGRSEMSRCQGVLKSLLRSHEAALTHVVLSVKMAMDEGASPDVLREILKKWNELFRDQDDIKDCFVSVYGFLGGNYIDGTGWIPGEFYPTDTAQWLGGAMAANGIFESKPYFDPVTQRTVGAVSTVIYGDDGERYGVIALNYLLHSVIGQVSSYKVADSGYALLSDDSFNVLAFPDGEYVGRPMKALPGYGDVVKKLEQPDRDILVEHIDSMGEKQIGFFGTLENGWRFGLVAPLRYHYRAVFHMIPAIALLACSLALMLCAAFIRLGEAKRRSEEHGMVTVIQDARDEVPEHEGRIARLKAPEVKILIADDMETNLVMAKGLLASYDVTVHTCMSGKEAVEAVKTEKFDLILLDHMMPEMDGVETLRAMRSLGGWRAVAPMVAITANTAPGTKEKLLESGFDDYLPRAIETGGFGELLEKWVGKRAGSRQNAATCQMPEIDGVDTDLGLRRAGGDEHAYFEALGIFIRDAAARLKALKDLTANDMDGFIVSVHGLKGASANMGAVSLAEEAALLEDAGQVRDMAVITGRIDRFIAMTERITNNIRHALDARAVEETGEKRPPTREELSILKEALAERDIGTIDEMLEKFAHIRPGRAASDAITRISDCVLVSDFEEASDVVETMMKDAKP
ncbi:MAG: response regulator [Synergistaceae bacterium]|jgi:CheY-like chemotaxis protein/HPt (histidine-containing phosphotransfer) domain-containing protein|nr:response regulator [Synergistaceae bacterium]